MSHYENELACQEPWLLLPNNETSEQESDQKSDFCFVWTCTAT